MKKCPFCAEEIQDEAIKCKHCGEWIKKDVQSPPQIAKANEIKPPEPQPKDIAPAESVEDINKNEAGHKQCPKCGKWDVYRAFIEDGGYGDWCPHCKKSLQKVEQEKKVKMRLNQIRPWLRFWARHFDYLFFVSIVGIIFLLITLRLANKLFSNGNDILFTLFLIFLWTFIEAALILKYGTTIGKWFLSISVLDAQNSKLDYNRSFARAIKVYWRGIGIGFPIAALVTQMIAYDKIKENGITTWDNDDSLIVHHEKLSAIKILIMVLIYSLFIYLFNLGK